MERFIVAIPSCVVPYIGTWIETFMNEAEGYDITVVPYIGTWIETYSIDCATQNN